MKSFTSLVHDALFPSTRIYQDANGNYAGSSTDITPWMLLIGRVQGVFLFAIYVLTPLLAPVYYLIATWFCNKYDTYFTKRDPKGWPAEKESILKKYRRIFYFWIAFMVIGFLTNWGYQEGPGYKYTSPTPEQIRIEQEITNRMRNGY